MKKEIYNTKYVTCFYDESTKTHITEFKDETEHMTVDEYKEFIYKVAELTDLYKPKYLIDDSRNMKFPYTPDIQDWVVEFLVPKWMGIGMKKYAQIFSQEIIAQLSGEQIVEEAVEKIPNLFETKIFSNPEDAVKWFNE